MVEVYITRETQTYLSTLARHGEDRWEVQVLGALPCFSCSGSTISYVYHLCLFPTVFNFSFFILSTLFHFSQLFTNVSPFWLVFLSFFVSFIFPSFSLVLPVHLFAAIFSPFFPLASLSAPCSSFLSLSSPPFPPILILPPFLPPFLPLLLSLFPSLFSPVPLSPFFPCFLFLPFFPSLPIFTLLYSFYTFYMTSLFKIILHTLKQDAVGRETHSRKFIQCGS